MHPKLQMEVHAEPFLRWAGSKRQLLPELMAYWGDGYERYIEPFAGCACLFYALAPKSAILGDINKDLIDTYRTVKRTPRQVHDAVMALPRGKESYYNIRKVAPDTLQDVERAARFIFLNRFCFNGLYRTNLQGQFNVPFASSRTGEVPIWDEFERTATVLQKAELVSEDFEQTFTNAREGDFVYMDPPFAVKGKRVFREYGSKCFGPSDLERLANSLQALALKRVHFVVSYADCPEARQALSEWHIRTIAVQRNIAGFARYRRMDNELIVSNIELQGLKSKYDGA